MADGPSNSRGPLHDVRMRLAKFLAHSGVASRRAAERLIVAGRVTVGDERVSDPARDVSEDDDVRIDGGGLKLEAHEVWMVNKPKHVVSTAREPGSRRAVVELAESAARLYPVGRLDVDSTGLILLTNDGELANRLTHPRYEVAKTYRVTLKTHLGDGDLEQLKGGVMLDDGRTLPAQVRRLTGKTIEITIREGRNRQIRRMAEAVGNRVADLTRIRFGPLRIGNLAVGDARRLDDEEIRRLWKDAGRE